MDRLACVAAPPTTYNAKCVPAAARGEPACPVASRTEYEHSRPKRRAVASGANTTNDRQASSILMIAVPFATVTYSQVRATSGTRRKSACPSLNNAVVIYSEAMKAAITHFTSLNMIGDRI